MNENTAAFFAARARNPRAGVSASASEAGPPPLSLWDQRQAGQRCRETEPRNTGLEDCSKNHLSETPADVESDWRLYPLFQQNPNHGAAQNHTAGTSKRSTTTNGPFDATTDPNLQRQFSFVVQQERQRQKEAQLAAAESAAAAHERPYEATIGDYLVYAYFCINCFFMGCPLLNSNAALAMWRQSDTFSSECQHLSAGGSSSSAAGNAFGRDMAGSSIWCLEQWESAKIALILYQSAAGASAMMGGVLVDTFSASMCMLIAHIMFGGGSYILQKGGTRGIFFACVLQGAAGELLLNAVLPICGLFGEKHNRMLLGLTLCNDLSVLIYPLILTFMAPDTVLVTAQEEFFQQLHAIYCYCVLIAGLVGTFLLPVDDDKNLIHSGAFASAMPAGLLARSADAMLSATEQRFGKPFKQQQRRSVTSISGASDGSERESITGHVEDVEDGQQLQKEQKRFQTEATVQVAPPSNLAFGQPGGRSGEVQRQEVDAMEDEEAVALLVAQGLEDGDPTEEFKEEEVSRRWFCRGPRSLWNERFTRQIRTVQFFIVLVLACLASLRCSFYLNNNQHLLELVGDDGMLTRGFMWILGLGAIFSPISWQINDSWGSVSSLALMSLLLLAVNVFAALRTLSIQWVTMVIFACARSSVSSTLLTYIAGSFGLRRFPAMSVVVGLSAAFFNFFNILIDRYVESNQDGDYGPTNVLMIILGILSFICVGLEALFPTIKEDPAGSGMTMSEKLMDFQDPLLDGSGSPQAMRNNVVPGKVVAENQMNNGDAFGWSITGGDAGRGFVEPGFSRIPDRQGNTERASVNAASQPFGFYEPAGQTLGRVQGRASAVNGERQVGQTRENNRRPEMLTGEDVSRGAAGAGALIDEDEWEDEVVSEGGGRDLHR